MILSEEQVYTTKDNINLNVERDLVDNAKAVILIVHGLAEHLGRYDYVVSKLNSYKYSVYRFDNRGHGKSGGKTIYIDDYNKFSSDVDEIVELIKRENEGKQIFIIGHSMGGMIATLFGIKYQNKVDGIILSAGVTADKAGLMEANINLGMDEMVDNGLSHLICTNKEVVESYDNDPLVAHKISGSMFIECNKAIKFIQENIDDFKYPVLILHGKDDKIVYQEDSIILFENIGSKYKKIKIYKDMYHEILNEFDRDKVISDINNWVRKELR
ncbi:alpha/beta hydrolase [Romboutsia sp.]|uniref:alpha/beta hydrolase n=1 Tax=Romboutsia sp. TaxID=1965302 RepID=UPI003F34ED80